VSPYALASASPEIAAQHWILEQHRNVVGSLSDVADEVARLPVDDLVQDAANMPANYRPALLHRFRYREPKSFPQRLLQYHRGAALQGIDQQRIIGGNDDDPLPR